MRYLFLLILLFFSFISPIQTAAEELVKVKLVNYLGDTKKIEFHLKGDYVTLDSTISLKEDIRYLLTAKNGELFLDGDGKKHKVNHPLVIIPETYDQNHVIYVNDRPYLGAMEIVVEEKRNIRPINQLPMEDYLKGVVPFEVFPTWDLEALKAQALAARTYAFTHSKELIDDTIQFQVYGGFTWNENTTKAVAETSDEVITHDNQLIDAFYSASNGGITENNAHVWKGKPMVYFPIKKDPFDPIQPWQFRFNRTQINLEEVNWDNPNWWDETEEKDQDIALSMKKYLQKNGYPGDIKILAIPHFELTEQKLSSRRSDKGSIKVEFLHRLLDGTVLFEEFSLNEVRLNKIRPMIGGTHFKSYLIDSLIYKDQIYTMSGRGNGHGVGMSQWGANVMGESGKTYKEILQFYYPGTKITRYAEKSNLK